MTATNMIHKYPLRFTFFFFFWISLIAHPLNARKSQELIYAFKNYNELESVEMLLVGEIRSKTKVPEPYGKTTPYDMYDIRKDQVTVKVAHPGGLRVGQKLYVIDKRPYHKENRNGLIVGEITVRSLNHSPYYGWILTGEGNLLRVREGNFVARTLDTEQLDRAYVLYKRGDRQKNRGDIEKAISYYSDALVADASLPEAHASLGAIYLDMAKERPGVEPVRARSEFELAWRHLDNFRYDSDRSRFFLDYLSTLILHYETIYHQAPRSRKVQKITVRMDEVIRKAADYGYSGMDYDEKRMASLYYQIQIHRSGGSPSQRKLLDQKLSEYEKILVGNYKKPVSRLEYHRFAAYYYSLYMRGEGFLKPEEKKDLIKKLYDAKVPSLYRASRMIPAKDDPDQQVEELIQYHLDHYFRYVAGSGEKVDPTLRALKARWDGV